MAVRTKLGNTVTFSDANGWSPANVPGSADRAVIDSNTAGISLIDNIGGIGAWEFSSTSPSPFQLNSVSSAPVSLNGRDLVAGTYSLYVADNKTLTSYAGFNLVATAITSHALYVGSNATFQFAYTSQALRYANFSSGGSGGSPLLLNKYGSGTAFISRCEFTSLDNLAVRYYIYEGTLQLSKAAIYQLGYMSGTALCPLTFAASGTNPTLKFVTTDGTSQTIRNSFAVDNANSKLDIASGFAFTHADLASPATPIGLSGSGTLAISGGGSATFSGTAGISCGLSVSTPVTVSSSVGSTICSSRPISVASGGTLTANSITSLSPSSFTMSGGTANFAALTSFSPSTLALNSGSLNFGSAAVTIAASTITGAGTLALTNGSTLSGAIAGSGYTGNITGDFTLANGGAVELGANISGNVTCSGGAIFLTRTGSHVGAISSLGFVEVTVSGNFTNTSGSTNLNAAGANSWAYLTFDGAAASFSGRTIAFNTSNAAAKAIVYLKNGATLNSPLTANSASLGTDGAILSSEDGSNTYSGQITSSQSTGSIKVRCKTGNTLTLSGALSSSNGRTFAINADVGYAGKVVITGGGFNNADMSLSQGTLHLNASSSIGIGGLNKTLTVSNAGTTVACSSSNATYAAQIVGNLSMGANTVLKFGAPA